MVTHYVGIYPTSGNPPPNSLMLSRLPAPLSTPAATPSVSRETTGVVMVTHYVGLITLNNFLYNLM